MKGHGERKGVKSDNVLRACILLFGAFGSTIAISSPTRRICTAEASTIRICDPTPWEYEIRLKADDKKVKLRILESDSNLYGDAAETYQLDWAAMELTDLETNQVHPLECQLRSFGLCRNWDF